MVVYRQEEMRNDIERDIVTGLIVDDQYCREVLPMLKLEHFQSKHLRRVANWITNHYKRYKQAPLQDVRKIFFMEKQSLKEEEAELIEILLSDISERYVTSLGNGGAKFNTRYWIDSTREYCRRRNLEILRDKIDGHLVRSDIDKAESIVRGYNNLSVETSKWINPFLDSEIDKTFGDDTLDQLFRMPGLVGELTGPLERDWLVAFIGPGKRGKSWYLQELDVAALEAGMKVAHASLEMTEKNVKQRVYARLTAGVKPKYFGQPVVFPVFDCMYNQNGDCDYGDRRNEIRLIKSGETETPRYDRNKWPDYRPCTLCREKRHPDYRPAVWYDTFEPKQLDPDLVKRKLDHFTVLFSDNFRVISYPPFGRKMSELRDDFNELADHGFIADVKVIDYFDITKDESENLTERGHIDLKWKIGKTMAKESHCLVATVSQSGRASFVKEDIDESDTSEDIRKLAHGDLFYGLNQLRTEKELGIMRINVIAFRHDEFSILGKVMVLQSLRMGQPMLDAEYDDRTYSFTFGRSRFDKTKKKKEKGKG